MVGCPERRPSRLPLLSCRKPWFAAWWAKQAILASRAGFSLKLTPMCSLTLPTHRLMVCKSGRVGNRAETWPRQAARHRTSELQGSRHGAGTRARPVCDGDGTSRISRLPFWLTRMVQSGKHPPCDGQWSSTRCRPHRTLRVAGDLDWKMQPPMLAHVPSCLHRRREVRVRKRADRNAYHQRKPLGFPPYR